MQSATRLSPFGRFLPEGFSIFDPRSEIRCASDPWYPIASAGEVFKVMEEGRIGGPDGKLVDKYDGVVAISDSRGGCEADAGMDWMVIMGLFLPIA